MTVYCCVCYNSHFGIFFVCVSASEPWVLMCWSWALACGNIFSFPFFLRENEYMLAVGNFERQVGQCGTTYLPHCPTMISHKTHTWVLWNHIGCILCLCVPCGLWHHKITVLTMARITCQICPWDSSLRTKSKLIVRITVI